MDIRYLLNPTSMGEISPGSVSQSEEQEGGNEASSSVVIERQFRKRPGKVAKKVIGRTLRDFENPRKRVERSYSREFKIAVLSWWFNAQVPHGVNEPKSGLLRSPLLREVSERCLVPITTLHNWRIKQNEIIGGRMGERKCKSKVTLCR